MKNILVIIRKQLADTLKNKTILIQFILFPVLTVVMENAIHIEGMQEMFFTKLFAVMYIGMAPLTATASIIAEEKEKNTLRVLMMAYVRPFEYLLGVGIYVWTLCMIGAMVMMMGVTQDRRPAFLGIMGIGFMISILAGAAIGTFAKNLMMATSLTMPVMLILAFAPMLAMFNDTIRKVAKIFYTLQLKEILDGMNPREISHASVMIIFANAIVLLGAFIFAYQRKGLD